MESMSIAELKRRLTIGTRYRLIGREGGTAFGQLPADNRIRTVTETQTNGIYCTYEGAPPENRYWLPLGTGTKAFKTDTGFIVRPSTHQAPGRAASLSYEWVTE